MSDVLIATSDYEFYRNLSAGVEALGYHSVWASNGLDVLEELNRSCPVIVFLDASLTVVSSLACCREIRQDRSLPDDLPVFLVSDDEPNVRVMERAGFTDHITKRQDAFGLRELLGRLAWR